MIQIQKAFSIVIFILIFNIANAQTNIKSTYRLGLTIMPQKTFMANEDELNDANLSPLWQNGLMIGINCVISSNKRIFEFGINYSKQGVNFENPTAYSAPIKLNYLKFPLMFGFNPIKNQSTSFIITGGIQTSVLTDAAISMPNGWYLPGDDKQWFNNFVFDGVGSIGLIQSIGNNFLIDFRLRGDYSLTDPEDKDHMYISKFSSGKHWKNGRSSTNNITIGLAISLSYNFVNS